MTTENKKAFDFGYQEVTEKEKTEKVGTVFDSVANKYDFVHCLRKFRNAYCGKQRTCQQPGFSYSVPSVWEA